jgi:hypothetical protein
MKQFIAQAWGSTDPERFPGPQPISIERKHFPILKSKPYLVCEKNDGVRNMLVCYERHGVFVDRMFNTQQTTIPLAPGTILDGELMESEFLVYDAVMIKGENVMHLPLTERLARAKKVCPLATKGNVKVKVKTMLPLERVSEIVLGPKTDGLIFTPVDEPVRLGTHETCFKWKPNNTIDFLVKEYATVDGEPKYGLWIQKEMIKPLTNAKEYIGKIVECEYGKSGWSIIKVRTDKDYPNNRRTYERTLVNIKENIQLEDFVYIAK